jgi:hypothetical protein
MMATKVGSLKFQVIQINGSGLDHNIHEAKFIPKSWVDCSVLTKPRITDIIMDIIFSTKACQFSCQKDQFWFLFIVR